MFDVTVNAVVGGGVRQPEDALVIARRAKMLGFSPTVGIIHDRRASCCRSMNASSGLSRRSSAFGGSVFEFGDYNLFQKNLANGQPNHWHCCAGSRYLDVCEDGLVHWCSQQRGRPGIPLDRYNTRRSTSVNITRRNPVRPCARWAVSIVWRRSTSCVTTRSRPFVTGSR